MGGAQALHFAVRRKMTHIVGMLLALGANPWAANELGTTPVKMIEHDDERMEEIKHHFCKFVKFKVQSFLLGDMVRSRRTMRSMLTPKFQLKKKKTQDLLRGGWRLMTASMQFLTVHGLIPSTRIAVLMFIVEALLSINSTLDQYFAVQSLFFLSIGPSPPPYPASLSGCWSPFVPPPPPPNLSLFVHSPLFSPTLPQHALSDSHFFLPIKQTSLAPCFSSAASLFERRWVLLVSTEWPSFDCLNA